MSYYTRKNNIVAKPIDILLRFCYICSTFAEVVYCQNNHIAYDTLLSQPGGGM